MPRNPMLTVAPYALTRVAIVAAFMCSSTMVGAQQSGRVPPTPPTPPAPATPRTPSTAPTPRAPMAPLPPMYDEYFGQFDKYRVEAEAMRAMSSDLQVLKLDALRDMAVGFPKMAPMASVNVDAVVAEQMAIAGKQFGVQASAMAADAAMQSMNAGQYAYSFGDGMSPKAYVVGSGNYRTQPPTAWQQNDPADSLYREARRALGNDNYPIAAIIFKRIRDEFPKSTYTPDAYYWEAFAMHRIGQKETSSQKASLNGALEVLALQQQRFPRASTRGDASALRTRIEGQLARLGDQQAIASLADRARNASSDGCPRPQDDERVDALNAVAQMDAEKALPILKKVLARREPCTQQLRRTAVWLVASRKVPDAATILLNVAKTDPDKEVREQAVFWMSNVPTEEATTMLIELAKKGDDIDLQKRAVYALSRSKTPRAAATLREIALDANAETELRGDALSWYMSGPGKTADDSFTFLKDVYGRADDNRFKMRVLQIIASRRNDESRNFLVEISQNQRESMEIRRNAIYSLQGSGVTNAQLAQIYDRGTDVEVRKQVINVLASLKENAGVDKLIDIVRNEKNVELRKQALNSLNRSKDPRVIQLYSEIIDR